MSLDKSTVGSLDSARSALIEPDETYTDVSANVLFDSTRTPSEDRPTLAVVGVFLQTGGAESRVSIEVDGVWVNDAMIDVDSGGLTSTPTNYTKEVFTLIIPAGSSYTIRNTLDPTGNNAIDGVTELSL